MNAEAEMEAWAHWREACALALISERERLHLSKVMGDRFRSMVRKINLHGASNLSAPPNADCAHLFETYCAMHNRRDGKKYKHWLLTRGRRDLDTVQSGVMLLIRNVVREWIRDAHPHTAPVSLQQAVGSGSQPVPLEQLLPARSPEDRSPEQDAWIESKAGSELENLDTLKKAVLVLRARGTVFSAPGVREEFGYGKSALHQCHRDWLRELADDLRERFPGLRAVEGTGMVLDLLDEMGRRISSGSLVENPDATAFGEVEVHNENE